MTAFSVSLKKQGDPRFHNIAGQLFSNQFVLYDKIVFSLENFKVTACFND